MSKFAEKKAELLAAHGENSKKVFNAQDFNVLGTALLNDPDYEATLSVKKNGETTTKTTTPVKDFRKAVIGGVLKAAGHDTAEQTSITENYEFPTLPLYPVVSEMVENYMSLGKPFTLQKKSDMQASIYIEPQEETVKEVKSPQTGEVSKRKYGAYRKVKVKSTCPDHLKSDAQ